MKLTKTTIAIAVAAYSAITFATPSPKDLTLLTSDQHTVESLALSLRDEPSVKAAQQDALNRLKSSALGQLKDGRATVEDATAELVNVSLLLAANEDEAKPRIIWIAHLPFEDNGIVTLGSRFAGDNPDRIYRGAGINPAYSYEIKGQRNAEKPSLDFSFEAAKGIITQAALQAKDIQVEKDGSFTITADTTPANGRKNHLQLSADTDRLLLRDTLADWDSQLPNQLSIRRVDSKAAQSPDRAEVVERAVSEIDENVDWVLSFLDSSVAKAPVNQLKPRIRDVSTGVPGAGLAIGRFSLKDNEALVITLDPTSAQYLAIQVTDPWTRSVDYTEHFSSLSSNQAVANADGSYTYVLSATDTGNANWLDTGGLHDGALLVRWELFSRPTTSLDKAVRETRVVTLDQLASAVPAGTRHVPAQARKQQLAARQADYSKRVTGI